MTNTRTLKSRNQREGKFVGKIRSTYPRAIKKIKAALNHKKGLFHE